MPSRGVQLEGENRPHQNCNGSKKLLYHHTYRCACSIHPRPALTVQSNCCQNAIKEKRSVHLVSNPGRKVNLVSPE
eukprot:483010-Pleurochrysis_carterae.AAC.2